MEGLWRRLRMFSERGWGRDGEGLMKSWGRGGEEGLRAEEGSERRAKVGMGGLKKELRKGGVEGGAEMRKKERGEKAGRWLTG
jgi:hypothetical protein